jgi:hypothetical protein
MENGKVIDVRIVAEQKQYEIEDLGKLYVQRIELQWIPSRQ